jgi:hypothetical protein
MKTKQVTQQNKNVWSNRVSIDKSLLPILEEKAVSMRFTDMSGLVNYLLRTHIIQELKGEN